MIGESMAKGICVCGGSRTQHVTDPDGCYCRSCMKKWEDGGPRCQEFVEATAKPPVRRQVAPVGHEHPETAQVAARVARLRAGTRRKEVYDLIRNAGYHGITDDEMETLTGRSHQSLSATRNTLMNDGLIVDSGQRRKTRYGNQAIVWIVAGLPPATQSANS